MDHFDLKGSEAQKINKRHGHKANANGPVHALANDGIHYFFCGAGAFAGYGFGFSFGLSGSLIFYTVNLVFQRIFHHVQPR